EEITARIQNPVELPHVVVERENLLSVDVAAPARALLVFEHHTEYAHPVERTRDVACDFRIAVAVVDIDEEGCVRQHVPDTLYVGKHVRPRDESDVRESVVTRGEAESAQKQTREAAGGQTGTKQVVNADKRSNLAGLNDR